MTRIGTCNFTSIDAAVSYYAPQEGGKRAARIAVGEKILEGLIVIGEPTMKPGQKLGVDTVEGRYFIDDGKP